MALQYRFVPAGEGAVELVSAIKLPTGKFLRDALRLNADNLEWFADCLEEWLGGGNTEELYERGDDIIDFFYGGTDWVPQLMVFNHGKNESSISLGSDSPQGLRDVAGELVIAAREAARRGVGSS